jgi:hypothetical protein
MNPLDSVDDPSGDQADVNLKFLVRCQGERVSGWQVRVPSWHPKGPSTKLFSDKVLGGEPQSRQQALVYRDAMFEGVPSSIEHTRKRFHSLQANNSSGLPGVNYITRHNPGRQGQTEDPDTGYIYWAAYWNSPEGVQKRKLFAVAEFGFLGAWQRAVSLRQEKTGQEFSKSELSQGHAMCFERWQGLVRKGILYEQFVEQEQALAPQPQAYPRQRG